MSLSADDHFRLGATLLAEGHLKDGLYHLRLAEVLDPDRYETSVAIGVALARDGKATEAENYFARCIQWFPERPEAYAEWSGACRAQGRLQEAQRLLRLAESRCRAVSKPAPPPPWQRTADMQGASSLDGSFLCPKCQHPLQADYRQQSCPQCRQTLLPVVREHIVVVWRMDGGHGFQCAACRAIVTGLELHCPDCQVNLITGAPREAPRQENVWSGRLHDGLMRVRFWLPLGILLLCLGVGQLRNRHVQLAALQVRRAAASYARQMHDAVATDPAERWDAKPTLDGASVSLPPVQGHPHPASAREAIDNRAILRFFVCVFEALIGGLLIAFSLMRFFFDTRWSGRS